MNLEHGDKVLCISDKVLKAYLGDDAPENGKEYTVDEVFGDHITLSELHGKPALCVAFFKKVTNNVISHLLKEHLTNLVSERSDYERIFTTRARF